MVILGIPNYIAVFRCKQEIMVCHSESTVCVAVYNQQLAPVQPFLYNVSLGVTSLLRTGIARAKHVTFDKTFQGRIQKG